MTLAIIPARAGSKRIPGKNVRLFAERPMIDYAITRANESGLFDQVVVSTDDECIAEIARDLGANVPFKRPPELSDDHATTVNVIAHGILECQKQGWDAREVCCIYPAVPFLESGDLVGAYELLQNGTADYVFPVARFPSPPQRALRMTPHGNLFPLQPENVETRTQDLEESYYDSGQFYWGKKTAWLQKKSIHANAAGYVLPSWRVIDIDTPEDWEKAEKILASLNR